MGTRFVIIALGLFLVPQAQAYKIAHLKSGEAILIHKAPYNDSKVVARYTDRSVYGSPTVFGIVKAKGSWLATRIPEKSKGLAWFKNSRKFRFSETPYRVVVDLSSKSLKLERGKRALFKTKVGVGHPNTPTPQGYFHLTDKLSGYPYGASYGCCILAVSSYQPRLPRGWLGKGRIAIHGTPNPSSFGRASSAGCVRANENILRRLRRILPLGTPVWIKL